VLVVEINRCWAGKVRSLWVIGWLLRIGFSIRKAFDGYRHAYVFIE
jgi:hypothetical protein